MTYGTITVGRLALREEFLAAANLERLTLKGQESTPPLDALELERRREDILSLAAGTDLAAVPVTFTDKPRLDGFYYPETAKADYTNWTGEVLTLDWSLELTRVGTEFEVDHESRLSGPLTRNTSHAATGERWLAPPIGHYGFWAGSVLPAAVTRTGADGAHLVYRDVPATHPRWGCTPAGALAGRVRFLDANTDERSGVNFTAAPTGWELANGLVRVRPVNPGAGASDLDVSAFTGGSWHSKVWTVQAGGADIGAPRSVTLLRNSLELVVARVMYETVGNGRITVDLTLRRGARFVELYVRSATSATLGVVRESAEAGTAGTGFVRATADDGDGNRYVVGSALAFTNNLVTGGLSRAAATTLDAFVGVAAGGAAAASGDAPADLLDQYLGSPNELVVPVRR